MRGGAGVGSPLEQTSGGKIRIKGGTKKYM